MIVINGLMYKVIRIFKKVYIYFLMSIMCGVFAIALSLIPHFYLSNVRVITIFLFFCLSSGFIILLIKKKNNGKKYKIFILVCLFISIDLLFASVYYQVYLLSPSYFNVSNSIHNGKMLNEYNTEFELLQESNKKMLLLSLFQAESDKIIPALQLFKSKTNSFLGYLITYTGDSYKLNDEYTYNFSKMVMNSTEFYDVMYALSFTDTLKRRITITDKSFVINSNKLVVQELFDSDNKSKFFSETNYIISQLRLEQKSHINALNNILLVNANLSFLDFFYFSTITITTTGYGDITPNSRLVRLIVSIQALFGILYIAFALMLFTKNSKKSTSNT